MKWLESFVSNFWSWSLLCTKISDEHLLLNGQQSQDAGRAWMSAGICHAKHTNDNCTSGHLARPKPTGHGSFQQLRFSCTFLLCAKKVTSFQLAATMVRSASRSGWSIFHVVLAMLLSFELKVGSRGRDFIFFLVIFLIVRRHAHALPLQQNNFVAIWCGFLRGSLCTGLSLRAIEFWLNHWCFGYMQTCWCTVKVLATSAGTAEIWKLRTEDSQQRRLFCSTTPQLQPVPLTFTSRGFWNAIQVPHGGRCI